MKQGDFTSLAKDYINRTGYSLSALQMIGLFIGTFQNPSSVIADVGAGTGKLTENLCELKFSNIIAVEPNDAMRVEGINCTSEYSVDWRKGTGEKTLLEDSSVDWLLMASSFHWVDLEAGLNEFYRVLKPGGFFTALWNPRDLGRSELHSKIEGRIKEIVPELTRVSSGSKKYTEGLESKLVSTGQFEDCIFIEASHEVHMSKDRYLGAWRSVNDIQSQAGPERFEKIIEAITEEISSLEEVVVPYKTRAWTVRRSD